MDKRVLFILSIAGIILAGGCVANTPSVGCTQEARICPDGTAVGRVPPNCEFEPCPEGDAARIRVMINTPFELFNETYQDAQKCAELGIPPVTGGCVLQGVSYDKDYISELEGDVIGDCWVTKKHRFIGSRKGNTEIITSGTCDYNKTYRIRVA